MKAVVDHTAAAESFEVTQMDMNETICRKCGFPGDLILCDGCPAAFHLTCLGMFLIPDGDWFCSQCRKSKHDV